VSAALPNGRAADTQQTYKSVIKAEYDIRIGHNLLENSGDWARACLSRKTNKIAIVSNRKVFRLYGETVESSLQKAGFQTCVFLMKDGERYKNFRSLEQTLEFFSANKLTRTDAVAALGGGVVGDLAGFASAIYLRGISFLQFPTTLLAMIDSSVGGKTGINTGYGKNLVGAFYPPEGVLVDVKTLKTLHKREITAGLCEAVKQGAIGSRPLFEQTAAFLEKYPNEKFKSSFKNDAFLEDLRNLIHAQIAFKAEIVSQDKTENAERDDRRSRKILNFGHTFGHALEKVTRYKYFKHGEAVGYGILFAADLAKRLDIFPQNELNLLNDVLHRVGHLPPIPKIESEQIVEAIKFDKKSIGGSLQWILPEKIGSPKIVSDREIPSSVLKKSLEKIING
jgi:3-dehydroquinate synthase